MDITEQESNSKLNLSLLNKKTKREKSNKQNQKEKSNFKSYLNFII